ncbi:uncharacterized protein BXZ73DRAFT_43087 [Epithele typhae]|uniref:uncharacterized protein n=1 Tax=Epithele typhae TaxID=378194 RepID=UPI002008DDEE|nr:uncharacterized protein BXZ73DRAFT_43087 [Epithele typhae]KAH9940146.1 hypothetical protein BXZ73DRAFT_43087 [Epithele typhae]
MVHYSGLIRAKPRWWEKVTDPAIAAKYRQEIVADDLEMVDRYWGGERRAQLDDDAPAKFKTDKVKRWPREPLSDAQLAYIFDELVYEASARDPSTGSFASLCASSVRKVHESQSLIEPALKEQFVRAAAMLENVPDDKKDWHPNTDEQVLDLVHPSLYPACIGRTLFHKRSEDGGEPTLALLTPEEYVDARGDLSLDPDYTTSMAYQWLPTDFAVSDSGDVSALGYINNLHPIHHRALYPALERILARFVTLFDRVLWDAASPARPLAVDITDQVFLWYNDIEPPEPEWDDANRAVHDAWEKAHRWPRVPDPAPFAPPSADGRVSFTLKGRTVQAIVKLASIHLTPEKPTYPGGSWHVEGMANERIVATGLYYYAMENVTASRLAFRQSLWDGDDLEYEQDDHRGYVAVYGFGRDDALSQPIGHVVAAEGKCVAFPNVYQHRVEPFELEDKTRSGHRKILALFLVDPIDRVLSTSDVPPQQEEWAMAEAENAEMLRRMPQELVDMVMGHAKEGLMSREEAEEHRLKLMAERSRFVKGHNEEVFEMKFNMCEH